jgi:single-strand DNA-binding protein
MARSINQVTLIGTLLEQPELRYTGGGLAIATLNLAGNHKAGERSVTWYQRVTLFGKPAEWLSEADHPVGTSFLVSGRLNHRTWEGQDGSRKSDVSIIADTVQALDDGLHTHVKDKKGQERLENGLNRAIVLGNLTKDPEVKATPNGNTVANASLAVNESKKVDGKWEDTPHFISITAWNTVAQPLGTASKGDAVLVIGHFATEAWTDREGNRRFTQKIEAERIEVSPKRGTVRKAAPVVDDDFPDESDMPF